jgi:hypothetical protein
MTWSVSRVLQRMKIAWSGVRNASQNVPLTSRPRTGGRTRELGGRMVVVTRSFLVETIARSVVASPS